MTIRKINLSLNLCLTALLLASSLFFGGSASVPINEMALSITALTCLIISIWSNNSSKTAIAMRWCIPLFVLLFAIQLWPLPMNIWTKLPQGRFGDTFLRDFGLLPASTALSIDPDATIYCMVAATPMIIIIYLSLKLTYYERILIINIFVLCVFIQSLVGFLQVAGSFPVNIYNFYHPKVAIGFFASRNHFADLILIGTSLTFALKSDWAHKFGSTVSEIMYHLLLVTFMTVMIASASRAGSVLFGLVVFVGYAMSVRSSHRLKASIIAAIILACVGYYIWNIPLAGIIRTITDRFASADGSRWPIWVVSKEIALNYWPLGTGIGSFREAYESIEPKAGIDPSFINAAHNEYLQIIIESGFLGAVILTACFLNLMKSMWHHRRDAISRFVFLGLSSIALHALVDFPLRVIAINVSIGFLIAMLGGRETGPCLPNINRAQTRLIHRRVPEGLAGVA